MNEPGELVAEVELNTKRKIYRLPQSYRIVSEDRRGGTHESILPRGAVAFALDMLKGKEVDTEITAELLEPHAEKIGLPFHYGHRLRFCVQDVLLILIAEGKATNRKEGRRFLYSIGSGPLDTGAPTSHQRPAASLVRTGPQEKPSADLDQPLKKADGLQELLEVREIPSLVALGEGSHLEFKASALFDQRQNKITRERMADIVRTICGFLNSKGGILLVGVANDGTVAGLEMDYQGVSSGENRDHWILNLRNAIRDQIGSDYWNCVDVSIRSVEGKDVARVVVLPSVKPAFVKANNDDHFYVRTLNATERLRSSQVPSYLEHRQV